MASVTPRIVQWLATGTIFIVLGWVLVHAHRQQYWHRMDQPAWRGMPGNPLVDFDRTSRMRKWQEDREVKTYLLLGIYAASVVIFLLRTGSLTRLKTSDGFQHKLALTLSAAMIIVILGLAVWALPERGTSLTTPRDFLLTLFEIGCGGAALWFRATHSDMRWWQGLVAWLGGVVFGFFPLVIYMPTFVIGVAVFLAILLLATALLWIAFRSPKRVAVSETAA